MANRAQAAEGDAMKGTRLHTSNVRRSGALARATTSDSPSAVPPAEGTPVPSGGRPELGTAAPIVTVAPIEAGVAAGVELGDWLGVACSSSTCATADLRSRTTSSEARPSSLRVRLRHRKSSAPEMPRRGSAVFGSCLSALSSSRSDSAISPLFCSAITLYSTSAEMLGGSRSRRDDVKELELLLLLCFSLWPSPVDIRVDDRLFCGTADVRAGESSYVIEEDAQPHAHPHTPSEPIPATAPSKDSDIEVVGA